MILFLALPFRGRRQDEAGEVAPGAPAGAPGNPMTGRRMLWATIGAAVFCVARVGVIAGGLIIDADIEGLAPFD